MVRPFDAVHSRMPAIPEMIDPRPNWAIGRQTVKSRYCSTPLLIRELTVDLRLQENESQRRSPSR